MIRRLLSADAVMEGSNNDMWLGRVSALADGKGLTSSDSGGEATYAHKYKVFLSVHKGSGLSWNTDAGYELCWLLAAGRDKVGNGIKNKARDKETGQKLCILTSSTLVFSLDCQAVCQTEP